MKKSFIFFTSLIFVLYSNCCISQDYWEFVNSPDSVDIFDIAVDSEGRIYLACPYSLGNLTGIFRSDNNCETWQRKVNGMATTWSPITRSITSDNNGTLIVGCNDRIYRSVDSGENWNEVYSIGYIYNKAEFGYDSIFLVGGGYQFGIVRSGDNGLTWEPVLNYEDFEPVYEEATTGICFGPDANIYVCSRTYVGGYGSVYISEDLGLTWSVFFNDGFSQFRSIGFDQNGKLLVGTNGLYRYDFQLENWEFHYYNMVPIEMLFVGDSRIYLACDGNSGGVSGIVFSNDIGETYSTLNSGLEPPSAEDFAIDGVGRILVSGIGYRLFRSYDTLMTKIKAPGEIQNQSPFTCYPNPVDDFLYIKSTIDQEATIKIWSQLGNQIVESNLIPFEISIMSFQTYNPGLYLVQITTNKMVYVFKIIHI